MKTFTDDFGNVVSPTAQTMFFMRGAWLAFRVIF